MNGRPEHHARMTVWTLGPAHTVTAMQVWFRWDWIVRENHGLSFQLHGRYPTREEAEVVAEALSVVRSMPAYE